MSRPQSGSALLVSSDGLCASGARRQLRPNAPAIECLRGSRSPLELARALVEHGAALRRSGQHGEIGREPLHEALELADSNGATALAERARVPGCARGRRPAPARGALGRGRADAQRAARRGAAEAAEGLTNAEIAQALYVTVRSGGDASQRCVSQARGSLTGLSARCALGGLSGKPYGRTRWRTGRAGMHRAVHGNNHKTARYDRGLACPLEQPRRAAAPASRGAPGRAFVFLHGLTFDHRMWDPVLEALHASHPAIALRPARPRWQSGAASPRPRGRG